MAQIKLENKGLTLIELILYMSIFCMIFLTIMSSVFYLQKIIQNNNQNYYVKNQLYENFNVLQQYLHRSHISIADNTVSFFDKSGSALLIQRLDQGKMVNIYANKTISIMPYVNFQSYHLELSDNGRILRVEISWLDNRGKPQNLTEYLIVINQNL